MRSFAIESNGDYLGECLIDGPGYLADIKQGKQPLAVATYNGITRLVRIVGITDSEGETLIPPGETQSVQVLVFYAVPA